MRISPRVPLEDRFWSSVDKSAECWEWLAYKAKDGYGRISKGGRNSQKVLVHRVSWEIHQGPIPEGLVIDHKCHNRGCVNPEHLRLVTRKQNCEHLRGADSRSLTGVRGVTWDKENNKFRAQVMHNYRQINIGRFATLEEAAEAARLKRLDLFTHSDRDRQTSEPESRG